ncbi:hypothetical protein [Vibrio furnissii]|uniref:hypothetical protein n=1 Tax=Vibrio furnissii TaxID=29494 RepID=UPI003AA8ADC4
MKAKFAQRSHRVVDEIGAAVVVAWFIIVFSIDLLNVFGRLLNLWAIVEGEYFSNMTMLKQNERIVNRAIGTVS